GRPAPRRHRRRAGRLARSAGERRQRGDARHEEGGAAARGDERALRAEEEGRIALDGHLARAVRVAHQEVAVVAEPEGVAVVDPLRLEATELAREARVEADETQS